MNKILESFAIILALVWQADGTEPSKLCIGSCVGEEEKVCTFNFSIDIFASDTGYFRVQGCDGVNPTLGIEYNVTYIFDQSNATNWYHPIGLAYGPDGVYGNNVELGKEDSNPVTNIDCAPNCDSPEYMSDGEPMCKEDCDVNFGLDDYEPAFALDRDTWLSEPGYSLSVRITDPGTTEFFYFCHIHNYMSGRIKVLDASKEMKNAQDVVPIPYEYKVPSEFDEGCGTFNVSAYSDANSQCPDMTFVCGKNPNAYHQCLIAVDCAMHVEMKTTSLQDPTVTFMHQMIAHHKNAVNMAKLLLKLNPKSIKCGTVYDGRRLQEDDCIIDGKDTDNTPVITMLWSIINGQNHQITFMESWLRDNKAPAFDYCGPELQADAPSDSSIVHSSVTVIIAALISSFNFRF